MSSQLQLSVLSTRPWGNSYTLVMLNRYITACSSTICFLCHAVSFQICPPCSVRFWELIIQSAAWEDILSGEQNQMAVPQFSLTCFPEVSFHARHLSSLPYHSYICYSSFFSCFRLFQLWIISFIHNTEERLTII